MRAVVLAYNNIGCAGLAGLLRHGFEVAAVFTHTDDPHENCWFDSVAELAAKHNIPVFAPEDINHPLWVKRIRELKPDVLFSFYYRKMVGAGILAIPPAGCMNLHGSYLPRYRGKCPLNWVLVNGEKETGVTLHHMTSAPDAGDIVGQARVAIDGEDTAQTLSGKLTAAAVKLLDEVLPKIKAGTAPRTPQDKSKASYFGGRRPADGEINWGQTAEQVRNLVRAVTRPWPGAYTYLRTKKIFVWSASEPGTRGKQEPGRADILPDTFFPGSVVSVNPLVIACGEGRLEIVSAQPEDGVAMSGAQLARELNLVEGMTLGPKATRRTAGRKQHVLILGANGFIGSALSERLLETGRHAVFGLDLWSNNLGAVLGRPGFEFREGDIAIHREWIEYHIRKCDVIVPLVAIATPIEYVRNPLRVFELDFEENLRIIRYCVKYKKRLIFPSTSEVYGMCNEEEFDEDRSKLILGPINKQRWIYSSCKQLLDRVIWAYGYQQGLKFTLFRPFNWIGPRLDSLDAARIGSSRVITQLILNLTEGSPILLIDGGEQKRCFTDVRDGIEGLYRIIENEGGVCDGRIINIGNPAGELSVRELAQMLVAKFDKHPLRGKFPPFAGFREVESQSYYGGGGYEDVQHRRPSIRNARTLLKWEPTVALEESIEKTLDFFLRDLMANGGAMTNDQAPMTKE